MSTSSPTTTTTLTDATKSTSSPTSTSSQSESGTATLYLFTFLATILILVLLSASLVLRSYILRRRYRQRFQQALADGLFADLDRNTFDDPGQFDPLGGFGRSARQLGPKPVVWDTWAHPADKDDSWSSVMPVAVRCTPLLSSSTLILSPHPSPAPGSPPLQAQSRPSFFSRLRVPSPLSLSHRPSSPLPGQAHTPIRSPTSGCTRSPTPAVPASPDPSTPTEKESVTLAVCVLIAMPDASAPAHRPPPDAKGKGVDPLESQAHQQGGDADSLLPSSSHRDARISDTTVDDKGPPLLEFGVIEIKMGDSWVWTT